MPKVDRWLGETDWLYCPKNDFVPVGCAKYAVTIHGAHELDPEFAGEPGSTIDRLRRGRSALIYRRIRDHADVVLTVSEWLKDFIVSHLNIQAARVAVVGNGVDDVFFATEWAGREASDAVPGYVLCVGGLNYLDGGDRIVALAKEIARVKIPLRIKVAGGQNEPELVAEASTIGVFDLLGHQDASQLAGLLRHASVLYYPTRYETFGMAAAEAMAVGVPIVATPCTAVPEIVGNCGHYVNADNVPEVMETIRGVLGKDSGSQATTQVARERARTFSWESCVTRLCGVFLRS